MKKLLLLLLCVPLIGLGQINYCDSDYRKQEECLSIIKTQISNKYELLLIDEKCSKNEIKHIENEALPGTAHHFKDLIKR